ncbi:hypothetical protein DYB32_004365 [Aphanomyces invadans]|uniref:Uncharacterized protein n=1 Tax=Aphanomyces invadans TaxID=157072 RepID=A0A3R6VBT3_9STRA|nr:hypothetical protein DYB32_004365 [Aphanomyces invadans]
MPYLIFSQMLLDDESTAGTMSDITDNVSSCFHDSTDAASWQVHAAAIQCAISRPHYFHHTSTVMTVFQQPVMPRQTWQLVADATLLLTLELKDASVVLTIDQTTSEQLLARQIFDLVAAEAAAVQVDVHQALVPSTDGSTTPRIGWEVVVEYLNYVGELPQATYSASSGVATMSQVNPRLVLAVYRLDNGTVVASARWTNTSACASLATTLQGQLMAVTSISSVLVDWDTSAAEDILTIVYKDHVGRLPRLAVVTSGQGLAHRIVASEASLVQTIQPLNTSQYIVGPTPCPCGTFGTTFAGALASVATSLSSSQPFDDISSLLETSATPADLVVTSCYAASSCPLVPPLAHSAVVITLTPTIVTLLVYPTSTGLATSTYSADFTLGTVPAILRVSPTTTAASLLQSLLAQDATLSPDASVDLSCDVAGVCRATLLLPYIAGPLPSIDVQTTTNANVNAFTSFPNHVDATTPQRLQRVTLRLF